MRLREVGTTNRTRLDDYARAIGPETAALLRVHPSNYRIVGFTESVDIGPLAALAHDRGLLAIDDVGSGVLRRGMPPGVDEEPAMADSIAAGADVVLGSGDKLLGGPQCGLIVGRASALNRATSDPLMRALRVDKMTLAALESTLGLADIGPDALPIWRLLATTPHDLEVRAQRVVERLESADFRARIAVSEANLGGGSMPGRAIESRAVEILPPFPTSLSGLDESALARLLRLGDPPVVPIIRGGAVRLDLKAVFPSEDEGLVSALLALAGPVD